jgi:tRNA A37 N6-isopentenylltransferase MiaA
MDLNTFINSSLLSAAVCAAAIAAITNLIVSINNNIRLNNLERIKKMNEIDKYRYSRLYELLMDFYKSFNSIQVEQKKDEEPDAYVYRLIRNNGKNSRTNRKNCEATTKKSK